MTAPDQEAPSIEFLISELQHSHAMNRQRARHQLKKHGSQAVPQICALASSEDAHVRWECAKTLAAIADPESVDTLLTLLEDDASGASWDAALGLIAIGRPAAKPLLQAIIDRVRHFKIISGAHHVLHEMTKTAWGEPLKAVYVALEKKDPAVAAPPEATKVLAQMESADS